MIKYICNIVLALLVTFIIFMAGHGSTDPSCFSSPPTHTSATAKTPSLVIRLDRYGDPLPPRALARLGSVRLRHNDAFMDMDTMGLVAFSHDGQSLFTSTGMENFLRQWDIATGKLIRRFPDKSLQPTLMVPSSDGTTLATCGKGGHTFLWKIATGQLLHHWDSKAFVLSFSPDDKTLTAICRDRRIRVWEVASGKELQTREIKGMDAEANTIVMSATGKTLASVRQGEKVTVQVWDVATGKRLYELPHLKNSPFSIFPSSLAFSSDGRFLATASTSDVNVGGFKDKSDGAVYLWDMATGKAVRQICLDKAGTKCIAFSRHGKFLATGSGGGFVRLWEVATGKELPCCQKYGAHILSVAFSPDSSRLAAGAGGNDQTVRVWEVATGKEITPILGGHMGAILSVNFTPDGKSLVSGGRDGRVCLWDVETSRERRPALRAGDYQALAAVTADGKSIVSSGKVFTPDGGIYQQAALASPTMVRTWDIVTGQEKHQFSSGKGCAQSLALSPDGKTLLSVYYLWSGALPYLSVGLWSVATGKPVGVVHHNAAGPATFTSMSAAFSPDNQVYAAGSGDGSLALYDVATSRKLDHCKGSEESSSSGSQCITFSSDGQELATVGLTAAKGNPNQSQLAICLWHLGSGKTHLLGDAPRIITGHEGEIYALAMSPDGRMIASAGDKGTIYVWEVATGRERCRLSGHQGQIWCLAFAPDGRRIASGSNDTTILVWDVTDRLDHGQLRPASLTAQAVKQLWADLASSDARRAGQAVWTLASAPEAAVAFLKMQLAPVPIIKGLEQRIVQLIKQLDDDAFQLRKKAVSELTKLGVAAEPALRKALESSVSAEAKNRIKQMLGTIEKAKANVSQEDCRRIRALEVLEQCGTAAARQWLEALVKGEPTVPLTRGAQASLARMSLRAARRP